MKTPEQVIAALHEWAEFLETATGDRGWIHFFGIDRQGAYPGSVQATFYRLVTGEPMPGSKNEAVHNLADWINAFEDKGGDIPLFLLFIAEFIRTDGIEALFEGEPNV